MANYKNINEKSKNLANLNLNLKSSLNLGRKKDLFLSLVIN